MMRGVPSIVSLFFFRKEFNQSNITKARMTEPIYHMTLKLLFEIAVDLILPLCAHVVLIVII